MSSESNLSSWTHSVQNGVGDALHKVIIGIPDAVAAILVLFIGVIVAAVLKSIVVRVLKAIRLQPLAQKVGVAQVFPGNIQVAELIGDLVKWFFIVVFLVQALSIAHLQQASEVVTRLLAYVPNVLLAAVLVFVGIIVADLTSRLVVNAAAVIGAHTAKMLGNISRYAILTIVTFTVLAQLGVNTLFLDRLFTGIVVMLAIAGGLAFGLGGQGLAKDILSDLRSNLRND